MIVATSNDETAQNDAAEADGAAPEPGYSVTGMIDEPDVILRWDEKENSATEGR
jgi:hypothetical protein